MLRMTQQGREPLIYVALVILLALPFAADLLFPLGTAVWVGYFLPVVCAYLAPRPLAPLIVAAMATLLTIVGFTLAPAGVDPQVAIINRSIGCITTFILAFTGYGLIRSRLAVQH